mgnify:FL=1
MKKGIAPAVLTLAVALLTTSCASSAKTDTATASPSPTITATTAEPTVSPTATTTVKPTPTVSIDPSPLAGVGVGEQQPSSEAVLTSITDEDRARAVDTAKAVVTAYTSGKDYKEWSDELFPMIDPELQNQLGPKTKTGILKGKVTGATITNDPTLETAMGENPYWVTVAVTVEGGISPQYFVRVHRTADRPNKWKAANILEPQGFNSFVKARTQKK